MQCYRPKSYLGQSSWSSVNEEFKFADSRMAEDWNDTAAHRGLKSIGHTLL